MRMGLIGGIRRVLVGTKILYLLLGLILFVLFIHYFVSKPIGLSPDEAAARDASRSISSIFHNPIKAPHHLLAYGFSALGLSWREALRFSSLVFGVIYLLAFYRLIKPLFGTAISWMGAILMSAMPLFLVMTKDGSGAILFFWVIILMALYATAIKAQSQLWLVALAAAIGISLYVPGLLIWMLAALAICYKKITAMLELNDPPIVGTAILIIILMIVPLGLAIVNDINLGKQLLLVPDHIPSPLRILKNIAWMTYALFVNTPHHSPFIINRLPIFNIVADALLAFGAYAMWGAARRKLIILAGAVLYAVLAAGLNDNVSLLALGIPAALVIMCAGLRFLYIEWRRIFPRNPLAKTLAYSLMWLVVLVQLAFGIRYALMAWPVTADTKSTYVLN